MVDVSNYGYYPPTSSGFGCGCGFGGGFAILFLVILLILLFPGIWFGFRPGIG